MENQIKIKTPCPSCNTQNLFVSDSGHITCSLIECKMPSIERWADNIKGMMQRIINMATIDPVEFHNRTQV